MMPCFIHPPSVTIPGPEAKTPLPPGQQLQSSNQTQSDTKRQQMLGLGLYSAPSFWDFRQEDHLWVDMPQATSNDMQELYLVPGTELQWVGDTICGAKSYFCP